MKKQSTVPKHIIKTMVFYSETLAHCSQNTSTIQLKVDSKAVRRGDVMGKRFLLCHFVWPVRRGDVMGNCLMLCLPSFTSMFLIDPFQGPY